MSDALILGLAALIATTVVTPIIAYIIKRSEKRLADKVAVIETKLDENHKLTNGHMTTLLETTKELATAQEKVRASTEEKKK